MKHSNYWKKRFEQLEEAKNKDASSLYREVEGYYSKAQRTIEGQIQSWYGRFAVNNNITMAEARKLLSTKELAELKWDVKEYIKYGEQNELNQMWMTELENASARFHISRLEALKLQTQNSMEVLFGNQLDGMDTLMKKLYTNGYYHTVYEVQKGFNIGWDIASIDQNKLEKIISKPWAVDGKNFSERLWGNKSKLVNELHGELTQMTILGRSPDDAIRNIAGKMNTSNKNAGRLVMTESAYFASASQKDAFNDLDVERFEIVATLDSHTSAICQDLDGHVFDIKDYEAGVTAPPFHVWCRTTTVPYFEDNFTERAARGADGKTYYVPSDMKYPDWKKSFTEGGSKEGLAEVDPGDIMKDKTENVKRVQLELSNFPAEFTTKSEINNTQKLIDFINRLDGADPNAVKLYSNIGKLETLTSNNIPFSISHAKGYSVNYSYNYKGELVQSKLTIPKLDGEDLSGQVNTTLHEEMHLMDLYCRKDVTKSGNWFSTEQKSLVEAFNKSGTGMSDEVSDLFKTYNVKYKEVHGELSKKYQEQITASRISHLGENGSAFSDIKAYKEYEKVSKKLRSNMVDEIDYASRNAMGGGIGNLQDIYDALSKGSYRDSGIVKYGHGSKYYRSAESQIHETVANYGALSITRPDLVKLLKADKPELVEELDKFIQAMLERVGD